jgi:HAD superfamily hydrolase (TIGR01450 family)
MPCEGVPTAPIATSTRELLDRYDGVLLDIYGVIVDAAGTLPGARELIGELDRRRMPYVFVTNDASRSIATYVDKLAALGIDIDGSRFVTSGSLVRGYFARRGLTGARTCVLGTPDSATFVREGGGQIVTLEQGLELDVLAVCDDAGFDFLPGMEWALSAVVRAVDAGRRPALVLPNPDVVYPKSTGELGVTAGAIALVIEAALARRFPRERLVFDRLGKPEPHLFEEGARRLAIAVDRLVMIGDQLETDIAGANAAGCASALLSGAISRWDAAVASEGDAPAAATPTWLLDRLWP